MKISTSIVYFVAAASLLGGCYSKPAPPSDPFEQASALGDHAGEQDRLEWFYNGPGIDGDLTDLRYANSIYARYRVCKLSMNALIGSKGELANVKINGKIWVSYNTAFVDRVNPNRDMPAPMKLAKRSMNRLGSDCAEFMANTPKWIYSDPKFGPFSMNPEL